MASGVFSIRQQAQAAGHGAWSGSQTTPYVEYLVVAGGGGGGVYWGGGGGAGGLLQGIAPVTAGNSITVTVGGAGALSNTSFVNGGNGGNSVFGNITAIGGGGGFSYASGVYPSGGSGGGGTLYIAYGGQAVAGQGNAGGAGAYNGSGGQAGGGGGGAGTVGLNSVAASSLAGNGGAGVSSAISGSIITYAGGGGGAGNSGQGAGGAGGGGAGVVSGTANNGATNTGGGGGGQNTQPSSGTPSSGSGGSGIVIISYPDIYNAPASFGGANSPTASTSGSGSVYFNGGSGASGGPYLTYPNSSALQFGSGNFTIEAWCYFISVQESTIVARYPFDSTNNEWVFELDTTLKPEFSYTTSGNTPAGGVSSIYSLSTNTWYHIAVVRNSSTLTLYVNGSSVATASISATIYSGTTTSTVGSYAQSTYPNGYAVPNGYLSNVRVVKGVAIYTSNFTPSTAPLTPISGTSLLLNTVSGSPFTDSSTNSFTPSTPSTYGKPTWNQLSPFATGLGYKNRVYTWTGSGTVTF